MSIKSKKVRDRVRYTLILILLILLGIVFALPFLFLISSAFKTPEQVVKYPPEWIPSPFTLRAFKEGFEAFPFLLYFRNSSVVTLLSVIGNLISTTVVAYAFARLRARMKNVIFSIVLSTIMIPWLVTFVPLYVIYSKINFLDTYFPLVLPYFLSCHVFSVFLMRQFFMGIPRELDEAAQIDGCGVIGTLVRIIVPNAKPSILICAIFVFVASWNDFFAPLIYLNDSNKHTLSVGLSLWSNSASSNLSSRILDISPLMAMSLISIVPVMVLYMFAQRYFVEGVVTTGIKG
ncbi:carbohydrate ABC transporter permease [Massiliimalia timonensis]|uniref:carbohydrate ABC transporter permease n=1 Tax=Massiliimalia timonensis TaxID=1987501 RepID=UPI00189F935F|nr:carbohydrate ABC transporter permease [Massiliimalia timonensis]